MKTSMEMQTPAQEQRKERTFDEAFESVVERYPHLAEQIEKSFATPQLGKYHNEGPQMRSHLELILKTLHDVANGRFHEKLPTYLQEKFQRLAVTEGGKSLNQDLIDYTFFHDLAKPDCLTLKCEGDKQSTDITWEQWQKDADTTGKMFQGRPIVSISYFHRSEGAMGQHGNKAANMLKEEDISPVIVNAIKEHEVAYQFSKINPKTYKKHFVDTGFSPHEQDFVLLASYIDSMGSLDQNSKPFMDNYYYLIASRNNFTLIERYKKEHENELSERDIATLITSIEDVATVFKTEKYDLAKVETLLEGEVSEGHLTSEDVANVLHLLDVNPRRLGATLRKKMKFVTPHLKASKMTDEDFTQ